MAEQTVGVKKDETSCDNDEDSYFCDVCNITFELPKVNIAQQAIHRKWCYINAGLKCYLKDAIKLFTTVRNQCWKCSWCIKLVVSDDNN